MAKKRNRQDATLVNIRATRKQVAALTARVRKLERIVQQLRKETR